MRAQGKAGWGIVAGVTGAQGRAERGTEARVMGAQGRAVAMKERDLLGMPTELEKGQGVKATVAMG